MQRYPPFGRPMRDISFSFDDSYIPLNHGSFGAFPIPIEKSQDRLRTDCQRTPDLIIEYYPELIKVSREALAPKLGCHINEVVVIQNATTGINTVLRNILFKDGDVVIHFSTAYDACRKTLAHLEELTPLRSKEVQIEFPISEEEIINRMRKGMDEVVKEGRTVRMAIFETVLRFPGVRMPWERLVEVCREKKVLSLIDGAHGIGHIDLEHLGGVKPDFFVSHCHKWLYTPRGCAVFYVPFENQYLIRSSLPTSHGYEYLPSAQLSMTQTSNSVNQSQTLSQRSSFIRLFDFVATIDCSPYVCISDALLFRSTICGGEWKIREYCYALARDGGKVVADTLGTHVLRNGSKGMDETCFANIALPITIAPSSSSSLQALESSTSNPLTATSYCHPDVSDATEAEKNEKVFNVSQAAAIGVWLNRTAVEQHRTYLHIAFHSGYLWVRLSAQIYLSITDFEWVGEKLVVLCRKVRNREVAF